MKTPTPRDRRRHGHNGRSFRRKGEAPVLVVPPVRVQQNLRQMLNWRVRTEAGEVLAIEPGMEHEHVFEGGADPFQEAIEFAAKQLREGK